MNKPRENLEVTATISRGNLDGETALLFLASVDQDKVVPMLDGVQRALPDSSASVDVMYAAMGLIVNAMLEIRQLSVPFRQRLLSGMGDVMADMLQRGADRVEEAEAAIKSANEDDYEEVDDEAIVYTLDRFRELAKAGKIKEGIGFLAIAKDGDHRMDTEMSVAPNNIEESVEMGVTANFTHVAWFEQDTQRAEDVASSERMSKLAAERSETLRFDRAVELDGCHVYSLDEFSQLVEDGALVDDDGHGYLAIKEDTDTFWEDQAERVDPSNFRELVLRGATHVAWYNK